MAAYKAVAGPTMWILLKAASLFVLTALAEIGGCYLVYRWLRAGGSSWLLLPAAAALALFAWLLTLHPGPAGRTYAAYGAVYVTTAVFWIWVVEAQRPTFWDLIGAGVCVVGMALIVLGNRAS